MQLNYLLTSSPALLYSILAKFIDINILIPSYRQWKLKLLGLAYILSRLFLVMTESQSTGCVLTKEQTLQLINNTLSCATVSR